MIIDEAIKNKRLFINNYHNLFMLLDNKINDLPGREIYGSRTILFNTKEGNLQPVVIELSLPPIESPPFKHAYTHGHDTTSQWIWKLVKAHASAVDVAVHTIITPWLVWLQLPHIKHFFPGYE